MSWDAYNKARKKAKELTKKLDSSSTSKSDTAQLKTAYKNAKKYKWALVTFIIITIIALCTLPFSQILEDYTNNIINGNNKVDENSFATVVQNSKLKILYVDVGQGDCILIDLPDGKNMIIDSGSETYNETTKNNVIQYIKDYLVAENEILDYMILTHPDRDHICYLPYVLDEFEVATIYRPYTFYVTENNETDTAKLNLASQEINTVNAINTEYGYTDESKIELVSNNSKSTDVVYDFLSKVYLETHNGEQSIMKFPLAGQKIIGTGYSLTFYSPVDPTKTYSSWNNYSCVMVLEYNGSKIAFTGDAETKIEKEILNNTKYTLPDVDIMDMGHHGSKTSSSTDFVQTLSPEYAIISCGKDNKYKHPNQETLDTLHNLGVDDNHIYITANNGSVVVGLNYTDTNTTENKAYLIACSGTKNVVPIYIEWWYVVAVVVILSGIILLIVVPKVLNKAKKQLKSITK